jgi:glutamine synthetase
MSFLNAAVAAGFKEASAMLREALKKKGRDEAVMDVTRTLVKASKNVRFEGNGYSAEWRAEAKKRGLPILSTTAEALEVMKDTKATKFLVDMKVLSEEEIASRYHINIERYVKTLEIELATLSELVTTHVVPAIEKQMTQVSTTADGIKASNLKKTYGDRVKALETTFNDVLSALTDLNGALAKIHKATDESAKIKVITSSGITAAEKLRDAADNAERLVSDDLWPLPKYREMLFSHSIS